MMLQWHGRRRFETITASAYMPVYSMLYSWMSQQTWQGLAQLVVYVRFVYWGSIKEDILFCKPLETRTTREDIFKVLNSFVTSNGLLWLRCVGICTDGTKAMTGKRSGGVTRRAGSCSQRHLGTLQHPPLGSCCQGNARELEIRFGHYRENC
jgi:hypothetical protein